MWHVSSVAQSCPTLSNLDCSMPGLPVYHQLPEPTQTHIHHLSDAIQPSHVIPFSSHLQSFPASGSFHMSQLFTSGGQSIGVSASTSVLPMNTQDWFPLGFTGLISLLSKGLSRVFSHITVEKHLFFGAHPCFPRVFVPQKKKKACLILDDKIIGSHSIHINCPIIKVTLMFQVNVLSF